MVNCDSLPSLDAGTGGCRVIFVALCGPGSLPAVVSASGQPEVVSTVLAARRGAVWQPHDAARFFAHFYFRRAAAAATAASHRTTTAACLLYQNNFIVRQVLNNYLGNITNKSVSRDYLQFKNSINRKIQNVAARLNLLVKRRTTFLYPRYQGDMSHEEGVKRCVMRVYYVVLAWVWPHVGRRAGLPRAETTGARPRVLRAVDHSVPPLLSVRKTAI